MALDQPEARISNDHPQVLQHSEIVREVLLINKTWRLIHDNLETRLRKTNDSLEMFSKEKYLHKTDHEDVKMARKRHGLEAKM